MFCTRWMISWGMAALLVLAGCSSGGGGGDGSQGGGSVAGLSLPSNVSIIASGDSGGQAGGIALGVVADTSGFAADSDYVLDKTQTWIWDESIEPLQTVNMILCLMGQTAADKMVNKGAYYALVDEDKCQQGSNQSSAGSSGKSTADKGKTYNKWVIQSTRQDNSSPMEVKIWVPAKGSGSGDPTDDMRILVHVTATEGVSSTKPFGSFSMNYMGVVDAGAVGGTPGTDTSVMVGNLRTVDNAQGKPQFEFVDLGGDTLDANLGLGYGWDNRAAVVMDDASGTSGVARLFTKPGLQAADYVVAYDSGNLLRAKDADGDQVPDMGSYACLSRSTFNTQIWRYDLYHLQPGTFGGQTVSAGERVKLNSGFPFTYGAGLNGYIGYWGLWAENEAAISDGTPITRVDYGAGGAQGTYTVNLSVGRMTKSSADTVPLSQYQGMNFYSSDCFQVPAGSPLGCPWDSNYSDWVVTVDANNDLVVTAGLTWGQNGPQETPVGPVTVTPTNNGDTVFMWSDALGGQVTYVHDTAVLAANRTLTYYAMSSLSPASSEVSGGTLTLYCYDRCLQGGVTSVMSEADVYYPTDGTVHQYQLAAVNGKLVLTDLGNSQPVDFSGVDLSGIGYSWGVNSGPMVADNTGITNPWDVYDPTLAPTTYTWESGPNSWNRLVTVTNDATGAVESFDQPLKFSYTLDANDEINGDPSGLAGTTMLLEYGGNGDLWGFPWTSDPNTGRWYSSINLKDGVVLADANGNQFVVKAREREQSFKAEAGWSEGQQCGSGAGGNGLDVDTLFGSLSLPPVSNVGQVQFTWADRPTPANPAPAVIEGEVQ